MHTDPVCEAHGNHFGWYNILEYTACCLRLLYKAEVPEDKTDSHLRLAAHHWSELMELYRPELSPELTNPGANADLIHDPKNGTGYKIAMPQPYWSDAGGGLVHAKR